MNLRIHRLAVAEIDHEVDYYESRQAGLGNELEDEIDAALLLILRFPEAAPQWRERPDRRMTTLNRFPFTIPIRSRTRTSSSSRLHTQAVGRIIGRDATSQPNDAAPAPYDSPPRVMPYATPPAILKSISGGLCLPVEPEWLPLRTLDKPRLSGETTEIANSALND
jgi:hypothetical protein